jgi:hypothetical protein
MSSRCLSWPDSVPYEGCISAGLICALGIGTLRNVEEACVMMQVDAVSTGIKVAAPGWYTRARELSRLRKVKICRARKPPHSRSPAGAEMQSKMSKLVSSLHLV